MHQQLKAWARNWLPPIATRALTRSNGTLVSWQGDYPSWEAAVAESNGYDQHAILKKVRTATLAVISGAAAYERDSVVFADPQYSWPLLSSLMWVAARHGGRLRVLDFGGSLGSSYFQHRRWFDCLNELRWGIVEQPHFVACGIADVQTDRLRFYETAQACAGDIRPDVVLLSSVLQYLPEPWRVIDMLCALKTDVVVVDRTAFVPAGCAERITVQTVREPIYDASYPCRFFDERVFVNAWRAGGYGVFASFPALDRADMPSHFKGFVFVRERPTGSAEH